ncbi:hypothetical protein OBK30_07010 [Empedobacter falsenii]
MFKHGRELQYELQKIRNEGEIEPIQLGFESFNDFDNGKLLQMSRGTWVLIGGEPHHGKSQFTNEVILQLMEKHDFKVALFSSESGNIAKVFSIFYGMYIGKQYSRVRSDLKKNEFAMNDAEKSIAEEFINNHLYVFEQNPTVKGYQKIENFYKLVGEAEERFRIKFDCVVIDPIYDIDGFEPKAEEVKKILSYIDYQCETSNRIDIVVNHVAETAKFIDKNGNRRKYRAGGDEFYGGKNNQRKAKLQLLVERPTPNEDQDLEPGEERVTSNQSNIHVLKAKPEGIAKIGVYPIFYDWKSRRYYERKENGQSQFSKGSKLESKEIYEQNYQTNITITANPNDAFYTTAEEDDDFPF